MINNLIDIKISEIESLIKDIFSEKGLVKSVTTLYEKDEDNLKLIISLHQLTYNETCIIHTKFIFKVDKEKTKIIEGSFKYLYEYNCLYKPVIFSTLEEIEDKIKNIIKYNKFGSDIKILSQFIQTPALFINYYFSKNKIEKYSVYNVNYSPKFKNIKCSLLSFDFDININDNINIKMIITKEKKDEEFFYKIYLEYLGNQKIIEIDSLTNMHLTIGKGLIDSIEN